MTSFTVTPWAFFSALTRSSGSWPKTNRRCAVTLPLKDVRGAAWVGRMTWLPSRADEAFEAAEQPPDAGRAGDHGEDGLVEVGYRSRDGSQQAQRIPGDAERGTGDQFGSAGAPAGARRCRAFGGADLGRLVEQQADDLAAGDAVDDGVMNLGVDGDVAGFEAGDDVHLPQRPRPVERARMQPGHLRRQLPIVARRRERQVAHVELEVEVLVLHPVREVQAERHFEQPPAQHREQVHAVGEQPHHDLDVQLPEGSRARVVDAEAADMSGLPPVLDRQELGVEAGELSHAGVLS